MFIGFAQFLITWFFYKLLSSIFQKQYKKIISF